MTNRSLGLAIIALGVVITVVGIVGTLGAGAGAVPSPSTGPAATSAGTASQAPATSAPSVAPTPGPTATPDSTALITTFLADLTTQIRTGTVATFLDQLDPAVIQRYGLAACRTELTSRTAEPHYAVTIVTIHPPAPWDYVTDGKTTTIADTYTVDATVTADSASGVTTDQRSLHVHLLDGQVRWFTDCGTPLP